VSVGGDHLAGQAYASAGGGVPRAAHAGHEVPPRAVPPRAVPSARERQHETARGDGARGDRGSSEPGGGELAGQEPGRPADPALSAAAPPGNPAAPDDPEFRDYVTSRGRALLRTAYLLTGNLADAEDLLQAALAKTYLAWDRIEDRGALDGYVRRAMVNTHISWWRRRRVQEFPTDELPDRAVADHAGDSDLQETLRRAIDRLPQRMRTAVMLRYYEDMTEAEVAERLGVSLGTVKSTVSRAVAKLRIDAELLAD
jgi:RNA polymerase sigma-70 factor (sigma-E family)